MNLGIVGTGRMAERMLACLAYRPGIKVTAIASATPARATALAARIGARSFASATALAEDARVDAVYIATTNATHAEAAIAAIAARKPVLVEKPLAATLADAVTVADAARSAGVLLIENLWTLTLPATRALTLQPRQGPHLLQFSFGYPTTRRSHPHLYAADAGVMRDRGVYGLALALHLFGPVTTLRATLRHDAATDVAALIQMRHTSGDLSQITVALDALLPNTISLSGPDGMTTLGPSIGAESLTRVTAVPHTGLARPSRLKSLPALRALNRWRKAPRAQVQDFGADPYLPMVDHFTDLIRNGQKESPLIPLDLSLETQSLIARALAAETDGPP